MKVGEIFVALGIKVDTKKLTEFTKTIKASKTATVGAIAALAGMGYEIQKIAGISLDTARTLQLFQSTTGLSTDELQKWQYAAELANVSTQAVANSVTNLRQKIAAIRLGVGDIMPFARLRIDPRQDPFKILEQLRDRIKSLDRATAVNLIQRMGISPEMMNILTLADDKFYKLMGRTVFMTSRQQKEFLKLKESIVGLTQSLRLAGFRLTEIIAPKIVFAIDIMARIFERMSGKVFGIIAGLSSMVFFLITIAALVVPIKKLFVVLSSLKWIFILISTVVIKLVLTIGILFLILDDIATYFMGGESVTGLIIKRLKELLEIDFSDLIEKFETLLELWEKLTPIHKVLKLGVAGVVGIPIATVTAGIAPARVFTRLGEEKISQLIKKLAFIPITGIIPERILAGVGEKIINQSNNFNTTINTTTSDPETLASLVENEQRRQFSRTELQTNNVPIR